MTMRLCPVCASADLRPLASVERVPVFCNVLLPTREEAISAPVGGISLATCPRCHHVCNTSFDNDIIEYSPDYESSLHFSPTFEGFATELANRLVDSYDIRRRQVVELGCGKGDFLAMLAAAGDNDAIGFDPSYGGAIDHHQGPGTVKVIRDTYQVAGRDLAPALVVSRHVLEHLGDPSQLVSGLAQWASSDPVVYLEVPDADYMFESFAFWDVIYEHPSYFTAASLCRLCTDNGLAPTRIESPFGGQYLAVTARIGTAESIAPRDPANPTPFGLRLGETLDRWSRRMRALDDSGGGVAIWGAGSKGVSFSAIVDGTAETITLAVDINPRKTGRFMPVSGIEVSTPDDPRLREVDLVLLMNPLYEIEVRNEVHARGLTAEVEVVA